MLKRIGHLAILVFVVLGLVAVAQPSLSLAGGEERVLVEFIPGRGAEVRSALQRAGGTVHFEFDELATIAVSLPSQAVAALSRNPNVVSVVPDAPRYPMAETVPWGVADVQALQVWDANNDGIRDPGAPTGAGITVCIVDSGYSIGHEDLRDSGVDGEAGTSWNTDTCGHGSHVAGTIAAEVFNNTGVVGVSPDVNLFIVKVFDGADCGWTYTSNLIAATKVCADNGADIISMSLGGAQSMRPEQRQFDNLYSAGILSIAAAGNEGDESYSYPASYGSVVSVAAIDKAHAIADFSQRNDQVELAAPGVGVLSTVPFVGASSVTVDGTSYVANQIEFAPETGDVPVSGTLAGGGLCESAGNWTGQVVLCQRGVTTFYEKVMAVEAGGGIAAVIYNNEPGIFSGTLGEGNASDIPAVSISQEDGVVLAGKVGRTAYVLSKPPVPSNTSYEAWDGTSMATPHVSAVAALLWSSDPALTNAEIRSAMNATALDLGPAGRDNAYGYGLVQAKDALTYLGGGTVNQPPTAFFTYLCSGTACTFDATGSGDPDGTIDTYAWDFGDGTTATGPTPSHTYAASGEYNVALTVTDNEEASDTSTLAVTVTGGGSEQTFGVPSLVLSPVVTGRNRSATATVTVVDAGGAPVEGATVSAAWSGATTAAVTGVTGANGTVTFQSGRVKSAATFIFTVSRVEKTGYTPWSGTVTDTVDVP
ncbi:MAG: S8 family serine peptidase [Anaerolineae bacterium]|nr:S8 family serine peptidase [Anaerolineae bacterium]